MFFNYSTSSPYTYEEISELYNNEENKIFASFEGPLSRIGFDENAEQFYSYGKIYVYEISSWVSIEVMLNSEGYYIDATLYQNPVFKVSFTATSETTATFDKTYSEITDAIEAGNYIYADIQQNNSITILKLQGYTIENNSIRDMLFAYSGFAESDVMVYSTVYVNNNSNATCDTKYFKLTPYDPFG